MSQDAGISKQESGGLIVSERRKGAKCPATELTLEYLRALEKMPWSVERLIPSKPFPRKQDLYNIFDVVYLDGEHNQVGFVQTTSLANRSAREHKMIENAEVMYALAMIPGAVTELFAWYRKKVGEQQQWDVRIWRSRLEYGPDQKDHVILEEVYAIPMSDARARARRKKQESLEESARRHRVVRL